MNIIIVQTIEHLESILPREGYLVLDVETTGLDWKSDTILSLQVKELFSDDCYYCEGDSYLGLSSLSKDVKIIAQNFKFDFHFLLKAGVDLTKHKFRDTSLLHNLIDENKSHKLEDMVKEFYNYSYKEEFWSKYKSFNEAPIAEGMDYACKDVYYTGRLFIDINERLKRLRIPAKLINHVHALALHLFKFEHSGIKLDLKYLDNLGCELRLKVNALDKQIREMCALEIEVIELELYSKILDKYKTDRGRLNAKKPTFNIDSVPQLNELLYDKLGLPEQLNDKRKVTTDDAALAKLEGSHEVIKPLREYREYNKIYTSFIEGTLEKMHEGRIYPSFNVNGTVTGRLSSSTPNLQQLPSSHNIRGMFVPNEGKYLLSADYCLPMYTEYLTKNGWKTVDNISELDSVWQVDPVSLEGSWSNPKRVLIRDYEGLMYSFENKRMRFECTENHRMLYVGQQTSKLSSTINYRSYKLSQDLLNSADCFSHYTLSNSNSSVPINDIWLACLTQADASFIKDNKYRLQLSEPRKVSKAIELLGEPYKIDNVRLGQNYKVHNWIYRYNSPMFKSPKIFDLSILGSNQACHLVEALAFWDGSYKRKYETNTGRFRYFTTEYANAESVQIYLVKSGYEASIKNIPIRNIKHSQCYSVNIKQKGTTRFGSSIKSHLGNSTINKNLFKGKVGCLTVPSGYILVRQNGKCFVTGNCQLEVVLAAHFSQDELLLETIKSGKSLHDVTSNALGVTRTQAKTINFSVIYGATELRIAQIVGCSLERAKEILGKLWDTYKGLKNIIDECHQKVNRGVPIINPFGRRRNFNTEGCRPFEIQRMKRQAFNFLVQSTGADLTNQSYHIVSKYLESKGIGRGLFPIHDEILIEVDKDKVDIARKVLIETMVGVGEDIKLILPLKVECSKPMERWSKG
jgi:DNA polymerase I-like protein with 3'-5' exonuclease and polymerase domains